MRRRLPDVVGAKWLAQYILGLQEVEGGERNSTADTVEHHFQGRAYGPNRQLGRYS